MQVTVKLYAMLSEYLPDSAVDHAFELELADDTTCQRLISDLAIPGKLVHLVLLNGIYVAPEERSHKLLRHGDVLALWPPIAGG